jgi:hypothetical protein
MAFVWNTTLTTWWKKARSQSDSSHADHVPGCIGIPLAMIFGYVVEDIGVHLLGKIGSIWLARSSGTRLGTGTQWLYRTGRQRKWGFL